MLTNDQQALWEEYLHQEEIVRNPIHDEEFERFTSKSEKLKSKPIKQWNPETLAFINLRIDKKAEMATSVPRDEALERFMSELETSPMEQWSDWALSLCMLIFDDLEEIPVRQALFKRILFPVLLEGYIRQEPGCARWLAELYGLLRKCPECIDQLEPIGIYNFGFYKLLQTAIALDPNDARAREEIIYLLSNELDFSIHEMPMGILSSETSNSVTSEEFIKLERDLKLFQKYIKDAGVEDTYSDLVGYCQTYFSAYRDYKNRKAEFGSYQVYLDQYGIKYPPDIDKKPSRRSRTWDIEISAN